MGKKTKDTSKLDSFHSQLTSKGFKYDSSGGKIAGMTNHYYKDDNGKAANITEREGSKHEAGIKESLGKWTKLKGYQC